MDGVIECLPHFIASSISAIKLLNLHFNRQNVREIYYFLINSYKINDCKHYSYYFIV